MPVYEYKCRHCGEKFELKLGLFHNAKSVKCPKCEGDDVERVFSSFATESPDINSYSPRRFG